MEPRSKPYSSWSLPATDFFTEIFFPEGGVRVSLSARSFLFSLVHRFLLPPLKTQKKLTEHIFLARAVLADDAEGRSRLFVRYGERKRKRS